MPETVSPAPDPSPPDQSVADFQKHHRARAVKQCAVIGAFAVICIVLFTLSLGIGAAEISPSSVVSILLSKIGISTDIDFKQSEQAVVWSIRMPRVLLAMLTGATLAMGGAAIQGLFRNPLAEPGLIGTSGGAAMAAVLAIVFVAPIVANIPWLIVWVVPLAAFTGSVIMTLVVYQISITHGKVQVTTMLLAGIAINAFAFAVMGLSMFFADDAQLRTITFWTLGSMAGATWKGVNIAAPLMIIGIFALPFWARAMDALALGESEAWHLGVPVERVRRGTILVVALAVGSSVSMTGMIGFVGLVIPHFLRMLIGPAHRPLLIGSAFAGAALLTGSDLLARTVASPSEMPLGVITALIGAPYFLILIIQNRDKGGLF